MLDKHDTSANPLGDTVMVGLAVTPHNQGSTANAAFADFKFVTPPHDIVNILPRDGTSYLSTAGPKSEATGPKPGRFLPA